MYNKLNTTQKSFFFLYWPTLECVCLKRKVPRKRQIHHYYKCARLKKNCWDNLLYIMCPKGRSYNKLCITSIESTNMQQIGPANGLVLLLRFIKRCFESSFRHYMFDIIYFLITDLWYYKKKKIKTLYTFLNIFSFIKFHISFQIHWYLYKLTIPI